MSREIASSTLTLSLPPSTPSFIFIAVLVMLEEEGRVKKKSISKKISKMTMDLLIWDWMMRTNRVN